MVGVVEGDIKDAVPSPIRCGILPVQSRQNFWRRFFGQKEATGVGGEEDAIGEEREISFLCGGRADGKETLGFHS